MKYICLTCNKICGRICDCGKEAKFIFDEEGALIKEFLLLQGNCCNNNCKNCPY